jgi:hypothetical protein
MQLGKVIGASLEAFANDVTQAIHAEAAEDIVHSLKYFGPYWTGEFEEAWVVLREGQRAKKRSAAREQRGEKQPRKITPLKSMPVAKGSRGRFIFVIDNEMIYKAYALDLVPIDTDDGPKLRGDFPGETSRLGRDWYRTYIEGGYLKEDLERAGFKVKNSPLVKGYAKDLSKGRRATF